MNANPDLSECNIFTYLGFLYNTFSLINNGFDVKEHSDTRAGCALQFDVHVDCNDLGEPRVANGY